MSDDDDDLPRSWTEAKLRGTTTYHGKVCEDCGTTKRQFPKGGCVACGNEAARLKSLERTQANQLQRFLAEGPAAAALYIRIDEIGEEAALAEADSAEAAVKEVRKQRERERSRQRRSDAMAGGHTDDVREQERVEQREGYARNIDARRVKRRERTAKGIAGYRMIRLRMPYWLTDDDLNAIDEMYASRKPGEEVDHIVPIHDHPDIAGLHVPWNLQVLTRVKNNQRQRGRVGAFTCTEEEAADYVARGMAVWKRDIDDEGNIDWSKYPRPSR